MLDNKIRKQARKEEKCIGLIYISLVQELSLLFMTFVVPFNIKNIILMMHWNSIEAISACNNNNKKGFESNNSEKEKSKSQEDFLTVFLFLSQNKKEESSLQLFNFDSELKVFTKKTLNCEKRNWIARKEVKIAFLFIFYPVVETDLHNIEIYYFYSFS